MNIGLIGCGNISDTYFDSQNIFKNIKITGCADIIKELSEKKASKYNIKSYNIDDLFGRKSIISLYSNFSNAQGKRLEP